MRELGLELIEADALHEAGKYEPSLALSSKVAEAAERLDYPPLQARAWLRAGTTQVSLAKYVEAEANLERAYRSALAARMFFEAASASKSLVGLIGYQLARYDEGWHWAIDAEATALAVGTDQALASYLHVLGSFAQEQGRFEEARDDLGALDQREHVAGGG